MKKPYKIVTRKFGSTEVHEYNITAENILQALYYTKCDKENVVSITLEKSLCECCASNKAIFPLVFCGKEPYSEEIDKVMECDKFLTEEEEENILSELYKRYTKEEWSILTRNFKNAFAEHYKG